MRIQTDDHKTSGDAVALEVVGDGTGAVTDQEELAPGKIRVRVALANPAIFEEYAGEDESHQTIWADLELAADAGTDVPGNAGQWLAAAMFNLLGADLQKTLNTLGGVIGAWSVTGAKASLFPGGAVIGVVMDGVTDVDAPVVSVIDGSDPSSETRATAAFAARMNNNNVASGVDYGLDLHDPGRDDLYSDPGPGLPLAVANADLRLTNEVCVLSGEGAPEDFVAENGGPEVPGTGNGFADTGSLYIDRTAGELYINTGSKAEPAWTLVGDQSGGA